MMEKETNILFIVPPCYRPDLANFSGKYAGLPRRFRGHVLCRTGSEFAGSRYGEFTLHPLFPQGEYGFLANLKTILLSIAKGCKLHREKPFDVIVASDPLTLGIAGVVLKVLTRARFLVEINGHLLTAGFLGEPNLTRTAKKRMISLVQNIVLKFADGIKCLNTQLLSELQPDARKGKLCCCFSDYVPTRFFDRARSDGKYIFFAGHPYYIKGVDVLIKAFIRTNTDYPEYMLKIMGHNNQDLKTYREMAAGCDRVEFLKPVHYDQMPEYFSGCSFFVLPSRSEAMGRVLIEAMASGKAVIASSVGGIPEVVEENVSGFLFENEKVDDLETKMRRLLESVALREKMGAAGRRRAERMFSEETYMANFVAMVDGILTCGR